MDAAIGKDVSLDAGLNTDGGVESETLRQKNKNWLTDGQLTALEDFPVDVALKWLSVNGERMARLEREQGLSSEQLQMLRTIEPDVALKWMEIRNSLPARLVQIQHLLGKNTLSVDDLSGMDPVDANNYLDKVIKRENLVTECVTRGIFTEVHSDNAKRYFEMSLDQSILALEALLKENLKNKKSSDVGKVVHASVSSRNDLMSDMLG